VVLGPNVTWLTYAMARALGKHWRRGDEIVVSRLDHDANVRPWLQIADELDLVVRWAEVDIETGDLPDWQYDELLTDRTRLVAVSAASNAIGTCPDIAAISVRELGADLMALSAYKWCGPHVGAVVAHPGLLEELRPDKLVPAPDRVPDRFEHGTPPFELYAGLAASVDHLAALCPDATGTRRERLVTSMTAVSRYEAALFERLDRGLRAMPHVQVLGAPQYRVPTLSFTVSWMRPRQVTSELARRGVCAWDGDFYSRELFDAIGVNETGGAVRLGLMHYNTVEEVDHLLEHVADLR
jgi:selenocysteine lyase/cysteine desulfurase